MISYDNCHCTRKKKKRKIGCDKSAYRNIFGCVSFWCIKEVSRSKFVKLNTLVVFILQAFFLTLYPQALGGKKISSVIWVFCAKEKKCMWHNSPTSCYWTILCFSRVCVGLLWQSCKHYFSHLCTQHTHMHHPHAARLSAAITSNISWIADDEHGCTEICSFYIFA